MFGNKAQIKKIRSYSACGNNHSHISSILKSPGMPKLKHHRSVRFEDPDSMAKPYGSFDLSPISISISPSPQSCLFTDTSSPIQKDHQVHVSVSPNIAKYYHQKERELFSKEMPNNYPSPVKIIKVVKLTKRKKSALFTKFKPRVLSYDFRNEEFYKKLSKFYSLKKEDRENSEIIHKEISENIDFIGFEGGNDKNPVVEDKIIPFGLMERLCDKGLSVGPTEKSCKNILKRNKGLAGKCEISLRHDKNLGRYVLS